MQSFIKTHLFTDFLSSHWFKLALKSIRITQLRKCATSGWVLHNEPFIWTQITVFPLFHIHQPCQTLPWVASRGLTGCLWSSRNIKQNRSASGWRSDRGGGASGCFFSWCFSVTSSDIGCTNRLELGCLMWPYYKQRQTSGSLIICCKEEVVSEPS